MWMEGGCCSGGNVGQSAAIIGEPAREATSKPAEEAQAQRRPSLKRNQHVLKTWNP